MFPQSELDNYKLQVELLQEKLQRSEISRQQLEHKLDKILQKRDEHDKTVRSKAKHKYQQFLEEQQRRNERNNQLVQMLERIEQQTEAMNARSERLKMMKLQYEMYFAKLVHSQTRRCLQSSVHPVTQMMATPSAQSVGQLINDQMHQPVMEGYKYVTNMETPTPLMTNPYEMYASTPYSEKESLLRSQTENTRFCSTEIPTLANLVRTEGNNCMDFKNIDMTPSTEKQQPPYQYQTKHQPFSNNNNVNIPNKSIYYKQEIPANSSSQSLVNDNMSLPTAANLLPNDKQLAEFKGTSNLSPTTSSTFEEIPNVSTMLQDRHKPQEFPSTTVTNEKSYNFTINNNTLTKNENFQTSEKQAQQISEKPNQFDNNSIRTPQISKQNSNSIRQNETERHIVNQLVNKNIIHNATMPKLFEKPLTSLKIEPMKSAIEISTNSLNNTNHVNTQPKPNEQKTISTETLTNNTEPNSSTTPVSIENIENAIYGELLSPLETQETQKPENTNVVPMLLENLVTQPEFIRSDDSLHEEALNKQDSDPDTNTTNDISATKNDIKQNHDIPNYEQTVAYDDYNNAQQPDQSATTVADYNNYESVDNIATDDSQQQQYDYSNYDPTQYSYPGYIYDETTGEYKPDPNAPADQYATDQQYTAEGYDQQYQQQDYDYNQTYAQDPTTSSISAENTTYNNYNTTQQEITTNITPTDTNVELKPVVTEPEPEVNQFDITPEEAPLPSTKVTKPTSILSTADKNDAQKKKKRVNFVDSSETDESAATDKGAASAVKPTAEIIAGSGESDFDFSSSTEGEAKAT